MRPWLLGTLARGKSAATTLQRLFRRQDFVECLAGEQDAFRGSSSHGLDQPQRFVVGRIGCIYADVPRVLALNEHYAGELRAAEDGGTFGNRSKDGSRVRR